MMSVIEEWISERCKEGTLNVWYRSTGVCCSFLAIDVVIFLSIPKMREFVALDDMTVQPQFII